MLIKADEKITEFTSYLEGLLWKRSRHMTFRRGIYFPVGVRSGDKDSLQIVHAHSKGDLVPHSSRDRLIIVPEGEFELNHRENSFLMSPNKLAFLPGGMKFEMKPEENEPQGSRYIVLPMSGKAGVRSPQIESLSKASPVLRLTSNESGDAIFPNGAGLKVLMLRLENQAQFFEGDPSPDRQHSLMVLRGAIMANGLMVEAGNAAHVQWRSRQPYHLVGVADNSEVLLIESPFIAHGDAAIR